MTEPEQGIEQLDVHTLWKNEALDFTPWLADNLHLLSEELGIELEFCEREKRVGPMFLDILAKEAGTDVLVAIENQLEWTDTHPLGQLLTYATGCNAPIAIWIAPGFTHEYAKALHQLNEWTEDKVSFYGVKIEVVKRTGHSRKEPRFRKVVYPGCWDKDLTLPPDPPMSPHVRRHYDFFQPLIDKLIRSEFAEKPPVRIFNHTDRFFRSRLNPGVGYKVSLEEKNDAWVTLHISADTNELTKHIFDELQAEREDIEKDLKSRIDAGPDPEWHWYRRDSFYYSSINIRRDGSIHDPPEKLEETRAWMLDLLPKLKEVFDPRVEDILSRFADSSDQ